MFGLDSLLPAKTFLKNQKQLLDWSMVAIQSPSPNTSHIVIH